MSINNRLIQSRLDAVIKVIAIHVEKWSLVELVSMLTLILVLFHGFVSDNFKYPVQLFFLIALFYRPILISSVAWGILAMISTYEVINFWHHTANHKFLTAYWLWTLCITHWCQSQESKERNLLTNARFLIMLTMAGACIQKLFSSSYMDGSFFEITMLTTPAFDFMLQLIGVDSFLPNMTTTAISDLRSASVEVINETISLPLTYGYHWFAMIITIWNLFIQFLLEALCLFQGHKPQLIFHWLFLFFIQTTYFVAPFVGFGFLICIWGYVLSAKRFPRVSYLYLISIALMTLYESPWRQVLF